MVISDSTMATYFHNDVGRVHRLSWSMMVLAYVRELIYFLSCGICQVEMVGYCCYGPLQWMLRYVRRLWSIDWFGEVVWKTGWAKQNCHYIPDDKSHAALGTLRESRKKQFTNLPTISCC